MVVAAEGGKHALLQSATTAWCLEVFLYIVSWLDAESRGAEGFNGNCSDFDYLKLHLARLFADAKDTKPLLNKSRK